jgi:hypothetical protein
MKRTAVAPGGNFFWMLRATLYYYHSYYRQQCASKYGVRSAEYEDSRRSGHHGGRVKKSKTALDLPRGKTEYLPTYLPIYPAELKDILHLICTR